MALRGVCDFCKEEGILGLDIFSFVSKDKGLDYVDAKNHLEMCVKCTRKWAEGKLVETEDGDEDVENS